MRGLADFAGRLLRAILAIVARRPAHAGGGIATLAAISIFIGSATIPSSATTANLWIDSNGGTCTRQATAAVYNDGAACSSVNAAYAAASSGDTVVIKNGSYPMQTLTATPKGSGAQITFQGESKAGVIFKGMDWASAVGPARPDRMTLKDFTFADPTYSGAGTGKMVDIVNTGSLVFDNVDLDRGWKAGDGVGISGNVNGLTWKNSTLCCNLDQKLIMLDNFYSAPSCTNCTFDNVVVRDQAYSAADGQGASGTIHAECWWIQDTTNLTITDSRTYNCISTGSINWGGSGSNVGMLVQNDVWEGAYNYTNSVDVVPGAGVGYRGDANGSSIQGANTAGTGTFEYSIVDGGFTHSGWTSLTMRGNIYRNGACETNVTYVKNLSTTTACGTDTVNSGAFNTGNFVDSANHDWRPASGSATQVDKGSTASYPTTDLLGVVRYIGAAPDAGPYEGY